MRPRRLGAEISLLVALLAATGCARWASRSSWGSVADVVLEDLDALLGRQVEVLARRLGDWRYTLEGRAGYYIRTVAPAPAAR